MGCFLGCFGGEKEKTERRRRRSGRRSPHRERLNRPNGNTGIFQSVAIELGQPSLRQLILSPLSSLDPPVETISSEKTPSLNPQIESILPSNTPLLNPQIDPDISENTKNTPSLVESVVNEITPLLEPPVEPVDPPVKEIREAKEQKSRSPSKKKVTFNLNLKIYEHPNYPSEDETEEEPVRENPKFPSNHRYQNWYGEEEETEEILEIEEDEEDYYYSDEEYEDLDEIDEIVEDSCDSYFSLSIDKDKEINNEDNGSNGDGINNNEEVNGPICKNTPVLTPVENLSQWKERKSTNPSPKITLDSNLEKENKKNNNNDYYHNNNNNYNNNNNNLIKREILVDASLSTWLVNSSENSSVDLGQNGNFTSYNERPILGALTIEDIKESSVNNSPRRSPSKSPSREDIPIVGTVGTYWSCTGTSC